MSDGLFALLWFGIWIGVILVAVAIDGHWFG